MKSPRIVGRNVTTTNPNSSSETKPMNRGLLKSKMSRRAGGGIIGGDFSETAAPFFLDFFLSIQMQLFQRIFFQAAKLPENFQREEGIVFEIAFGQSLRLLTQ